MFAASADHMTFRRKAGSFGLEISPLSTLSQFAVGTALCTC